MSGIRAVGTNVETYRVIGVGADSGVGNRADVNLLDGGVFVGGTAGVG